MSRRASARVVALLSAVALASGVAAATTTFDSTVVASPCCSGHK